MKKSFVATEEVAEGDIAQPDTELLDAVDGDSDSPASRALAVRQNMTIGAVSGDIDARDIQTPRLEIAYGVGKYVEKGVPPGCLVLAGDYVLAKPKDLLTVVALSANVYWKEYLRGMPEPGVYPKVFATAAEVLANGGTVTWHQDETGQNVGPTYSKAMDLNLLICRPEGVTCGLFGLELSGAMWAPARWSIDKTAYRRVGPIIVTANRFSLKARGLLSGIFELSTRIEKVNNNATVVPFMRLAGYNSEEVVAQLNELFGNITGVSGDQDDAVA